MSLSLVNGYNRGLQSLIEPCVSLSYAEGSVSNYTKCCIYAILRLERKYVKWPDAEERRAIKRRVGETSFFKDCVGFINETLICLALAPSKNKEDYWTRKSIYALNSLIICDDCRCVTYAHHGWCGSTHDQRVLKSTRVCSGSVLVNSTTTSLLYPFCPLLMNPI